MLVIAGTLYIATANLSSAASMNGAVSAADEQCLSCHENLNGSMIAEYKHSRHAKVGVGCTNCHGAKKGEPDAQDHNGHTISAIVSPKDCAQCHQEEFAQMAPSHHASANKFTGSLDNVLGRVVTGTANYMLACNQCHGSNIKLNANGHPVAPTWPNNGIGRVNPDGSLGSCSACHNRHSFSIKQVRSPETCGKCHQGPDHPQYEIFELSKHGIQYDSMKEDMKLDSHEGWVLGKDYTQAPNCVTCHMGAAVNGVKRTHNVGARLKWTLRPPVSKVLHAEPNAGLPDGNKRRLEMIKVCQNCHSNNWITQQMEMFDQYVDLYNNKFAKPATAIIGWLHKNKVIDGSPFNDLVEYDYFELWHHEGRRGRHGAAMMNPDYAHWHGMYEVSYNFYFKVIPHANDAVEKAYKAGKISAAKRKAWIRFRNKIINRQEHKWIKGLSKKQLREISNFYDKRYRQSVSGNK